MTGKSPSPPPYWQASSLFRTGGDGAGFREGCVCVRGRGGGCTVKMSSLLGGELRQDHRSARTRVCMESLSLSSPYGALREVVVVMMVGGGLNVSGIVERVALQFREGDGRMLQVVEQHLDLRKQKTTYFYSFINSPYYPTRRSSTSSYAAFKTTRNWDFPSWNNQLTTSKSSRCSTQNHKQTSLLIVTDEYSLFGTEEVQPPHFFCCHFLSFPK